MEKLTAEAICSKTGFIILARERGAAEWVELGVVEKLASARSAIMFLQADSDGLRGYVAGTLQRSGRAERRP